MSKHTPGPWEYTEVRNYVGRIVGFDIHRGGKDLIAHVSVSDEFDADEVERRRQDATRLAASLEMLAALDVAVSEMRDYHFEHPSMAQILAAIDRAEGRASIAQILADTAKAAEEAQEVDAIRAQESEARSHGAL